MRLKGDGGQALILLSRSQIAIGVGQLARLLADAVFERLVHRAQHTPRGVMLNRNPGLPRPDRDQLKLQGDGRSRLAIVQGQCPQHFSIKRKYRLRPACADPGALSQIPVVGPIRMLHHVMNNDTLPTVRGRSTRPHVRTDPQPIHGLVVEIRQTRRRADSQALRVRFECEHRTDHAGKQLLDGRNQGGQHTGQGRAPRDLFQHAAPAQLGKLDLLPLADVYDRAPQHIPLAPRHPDQANLGQESLAIGSKMPPFEDRFLAGDCLLNVLPATLGRRTVRL